jgi:signal transduction histidine kinase
MALRRLRRPPRLGLRPRITLAFAASGLLLSALLAGSTWTITRESLLTQREASATRQAYQNARYMQTQIPEGADTPPVREALNDIVTTARPLMRIEDVSGEQVWISRVPSFDQDALPASLKQVVAKGRAARMRYRLNGEPELAIGIPLPEENAAYFEIVSLDELQSTLESLAVSLFGASLVTTLAGAALGYWISRRTLRPLSNVGVAAEAIAGGRLDTRLEGGNDPDLEALVTSFNHMAQALEERIERDGRFASDVSHELRSPLMTLAASIEVLALRRDEMPDESSRAAVDLMAGDISRFQQLVDDLLEISRFDAGVARLSLDDVSPVELVHHAIDASTDRNVPIQAGPDLEELVVRADKRRLVRVIANLLDNAEKYGGGATAVTVENHDGNVEIAVEDAGAGIPEEDRDLVFERFSRGAGAAGRRSGSSDGVGLGLALVSEHVRLHGGSVRVEDRRDGQDGARFVISLPANPSDLIVTAGPTDEAGPS